MRIAFTTHNATNMSYDDAIIHLKLNPTCTIQSAATLFGLDRSNLSRRFRGKTVSREQYLHQINRKLTVSQEKKLIKHVNILTNHGNLPTYPMVRRFASEISKKSLGKHWAQKFVKRYKDKLSSGFLDAIEVNRKKADSPKSYQRWFDQVSILKFI